MWGFLKQVLTLRALTLLVSVPGITKLCVIKRHQRTGLSYKIWFGGLLGPVTVQSFPSHSFLSLRKVVLRRMLITFLREGSKEGMCCKCVRNGDVSIYTQSRMCCELHPPCLWHTDPRVGHAALRLFTHIFTCFVFSLWLHTASPVGVLTLIRLKWAKQGL